MGQIQRFLTAHFLCIPYSLIEAHFFLKINLSVNLYFRFDLHLPLFIFMSVLHIFLYSRGKYNIIKKHLDLLQVAMATSQSLRNQGQTAAATAAEKNLIQAQADSMDGEGAVSALALLSRLAEKEIKASPGDR